MKKQPIGFMDSGVGGLTVLKEAMRQLPNEDLIFIGDQARLPYGEKPAEIVKGFAWQMTNFLVRHEIKALVVACNTATAAALPDLQAQLAIPVIGVIAPGSQLASTVTKNQQVGVIATTGTIQSGAYSQQLKALVPEMTVNGLAVPDFVMMIEANQRHGAAVQQKVNQLLAPLKMSQIDTLILGCTHFPLLATAIQTAVGPNVTLVDPAKAAVADLVQVLSDRQVLADTQQAGRLQTFTTGQVSDFTPIARQWLGLPDLNAQQVTIQGEKNDGPN
ncbi:glutamate racemase [Latilactobacillus fuchuensis]|jgi:glutamate racemase|uniref:Glutamate racemase n=2 Tax=Latilactobacillus fuchuensis TaxID=164393 RepID=A0A2N9DTX5_9LACO|nr:glutamate racemase [Latilactobacillus fuchuensis]KRL61023.1 glutamate racemase [Latilactobacillus fuchuensis DSM 14340 = JCM 11249]SPC37049.1 glutamate racemase [Latilactobacillus fuchuensis]